MSNPSLQPPRGLVVLSLSGLHLDSLGLCLSALGLLSLCSRHWTSVRGGWRGGVFYLAGGPTNEGELVKYVAAIGERGEWSSYRKGWDKHQKADTKAKSGRNTALWRAREAEEDSLALLQSHISPASRLSFNPLFGTGGNAGKRDFASGWAKATSAIQKPPKGWKRETLNSDLAAFLRGEPGVCLADYNAGCWFGSANKAFNSGTARPFRDGQVSPWAMALACEAFGLFQGSPSRQLGSARRATGAFPFVTSGAAPTAPGEAGKNLGELWLPVWEQPIAGIREFRRFLLLRTTSENTFESRLASIISVSGKAESATATALTRMLGFRDSLPADRKKGKRWIYAGLRGPLDDALVAFAEKPTPESARAAVDAMIWVLRKADRNRGHRAHKPSIQFQQLPGAWAASLLGSDGSDACGEARIGLALATLFPGKRIGKANKVSAAPLLAYWLGVQQRGTYCSIPEAVPFRRVWGAGRLAANFAVVLQRRLIEEGPSAEPPFGAWYGIGLGDIEAWLSGALDDTEIERWTMRFSLFHWEKEGVATASSRLGHPSPPHVFSGSLALFTLFKPLFQQWLLNALLPEGSKREAAKTGPLCGIAAQLARGDITAAVQLARTAYRAAGIEPAKLRSDQFSCDDSQRLLAALLIPAQRRGITDDSFDELNRKIPALCTRWLIPHKNTNNT